MGRKIDLDRLLEECNFLKSDDAGFCGKCKHQNTTENCSECIIKVAESLVEPEIDFDGLYDELDNLPSDNLGAAKSFLKFLKSKHLTAPKPKQIPVKKVWTLKKEVSETLPEEHLKKYYDLHEELDYSKIPVGAVVGVFTDLSRNPNYGIVQKNGDCILSITSNIDNINTFHISYSHIKSLEILMLPEVK